MTKEGSQGLVTWEGFDLQVSAREERTGSLTPSCTRCLSVSFIRPAVHQVPCEPTRIDTHGKQ